MMGVVLMLVGGIWSLTGVANLLLILGRPVPTGLETFGVIFNVVLFILPGLICVGIGQYINGRSRA